MTKIPNWSRADEEYSGNDKIIAAWEHDEITQRVIVEKRSSVRGQDFYSIQQQNFPDGFDEHGYFEEVDNPTHDTREEAMESARAQLKRFTNGFTITGLMETDVEDLPRKNQGSDIPNWTEINRNPPSNKTSSNGIKFWKHDELGAILHLKNWGEREYGKRFTLSLSSPKEEYGLGEKHNYMGTVDFGEFDNREDAIERAEQYMRDNTDFLDAPEEAKRGGQ